MFLTIRFLQCVCRMWISPKVSGSSTFDSIQNNLLHFGTLRPSLIEVIIETPWTKSRRCKEKVKDDTRMGRTGHISSPMDHCLFRCSCWTGLFLLHVHGHDMSSSRRLAGFRMNSRWGFADSLATRIGTPRTSHSLTPGVRTPFWFTMTNLVILKL